MSKSEPSTIGGLLSAALARELSEDEMRQNNDDETELVATLLYCYLSGENVHYREVCLRGPIRPRLTFTVTSAGRRGPHEVDASHHQGHRRPAHADTEGCEEGRDARTSDDEDALVQEPFPAADRVHVARTLTEARRVIEKFSSPEMNDRLHAAAAAARRVAHGHKGGRAVAARRRRRSLIHDLL